jgi:hypothetical protein
MSMLAHALVSGSCSLFFAGTASAQNTIVSPLVSATSEGVSANVFPWTSSVQRRYQQIHADLGPSPRAIRSLAFRLDLGNATYNGVWTAAPCLVTT